MSTRLQLRGRVRDYLDEPTPAYWTDAELNNWINQAYFYYFQWIAQSFDGYFAKDTLLNINAGNPKVPFPVDCWKLRLVERVYATFTVPLKLFERMDSANIIANTNFSNLYLPTYRLEGQNIVLEPTPDTTITNGLRVEYLQTPTTLTLDTSTPDAGYLEMWEEPIVLKAAISAKMKEESVVNSGTDVTTLSTLLANWEQMIKESAEERSLQRHYSEPFGADDGDSYYYP